jgi:hypothetical protein
MSNCGCSPSGYPSANNECCDDVANLARFAYANAQQAAASAANAATTLADAVQKSGDTMTGPLILSGDPVALLGASTKQYVDNAVSIGLTIPDGSITTPKLANLAVDTGKIADGSVTTIKLATNAVDNSKIQDLSISTNKIADNQITAAKLGTNEKNQIVKAWVNFDGSLASPISPTQAYNVSSVTKNSTGDYTINFTSALPNADYAIVGMAVTFNTNGDQTCVALQTTGSGLYTPALKSTTQARIIVSRTQTNTPNDNKNISIIVI